MAEVFLHARSADEFAGMRRAIDALANGFLRSRFSMRTTGSGLSCMEATSGHSCSFQIATR